MCVVAVIKLEFKVYSCLISFNTREYMYCHKRYTNEVNYLPMAASSFERKTK